MVGWEVVPPVLAGIFQSIWGWLGPVCAVIGAIMLIVIGLVIVLVVLYFVNEARDHDGPSTGETARGLNQEDVPPAKESTDIGKAADKLFLQWQRINRFDFDYSVGVFAKNLCTMEAEVEASLRQEITLRDPHT